MRQKSKVSRGLRLLRPRGVHPGLSNLDSKESCFKTVYHDNPSIDNPQGTVLRTVTEVPEGKLHLPLYYDTLKTLDQTVPAVDYYPPGRPPEADRIWDAIVAILEQKPPEPGSIIGSDTTVCDDCPRTREEKKISSFTAPGNRRTWTSACSSRGILCCGIATRAGLRSARRSTRRASGAMGRTTEWKTTRKWPARCRRPR